MKTYQIGRRMLSEQPTAVARATLRVDDIGPWLSSAYGEVARYLGAQGAGPVGPPFARYHRLTGDRFDVEAGFPASGLVEPTPQVKASSLPGGPAAWTMHVGPYGEMEPAYAALATWMQEHGYETVGDPWEIYFSDPAAEPDPENWRTEIVEAYRER